MPIVIVQQNEKVAEVKFICDCCGKLIKTSVIPKKELEEQKNQTFACFTCQQKK
jgi:hypothetical protein